MRKRILLYGEDCPAGTGEWGKKGMGMRGEWE